MKNFDYQTPTRLIFGRDVVAGLPEVMRPFGRRILLTYGGGSIKRIGLYDRVKELLKDFEIFELGGIEPNPKYSTSVVEGVRICKEQQIDVILSVGGGLFAVGPYRRYGRHAVQGLLSDDCLLNSRFSGDRPDVGAAAVLSAAG